MKKVVLWFLLFGEFLGGMAFWAKYLITQYSGAGDWAVIVVLGLSYAGGCYLAWRYALTGEWI